MMFSEKREELWYHSMMVAKRELFHQLFSPQSSFRPQSTLAERLELSCQFTKAVRQEFSPHPNLWASRGLGKMVARQAKALLKLLLSLLHQP
jgi:hypothetical protein